MMEVITMLTPQRWAFKLAVLIGFRRGGKEGKPQLILEPMVAKLS